MIFAVDIGNTNIVISIFNKNKIVFTARISSKSHLTEDQFAIQIGEICHFYKVNPEEIEGGIISSVVPQLTVKLKKSLEKISNCKIYVVGPGVKTGLNIKIDSPSELGADFVCSAVSAKNDYPLPLIVIDMGTATKISALNEKGDFLGGSIMPGLRISADALSVSTAQLPFVSLENPGDIIGKNTVDSMKSGIIYGTAAMIDGMIERYKKALNTDELTVVITGGNSRVIIPYFQNKVIYDEDIILKGLNIIYGKNA